MSAEVTNERKEYFEIERKAIQKTYPIQDLETTADAISLRISNIQPEWSTSMKTTKTNREYVFSHMEKNKRKGVNICISKDGVSLNIFSTDEFDENLIKVNLEVENQGFHYDKSLYLPRKTQETLWKNVDPVIGFMIKCFNVAHAFARLKFKNIETIYQNDKYFAVEFQWKLHTADWRPNIHITAEIPYKNFLIMNVVFSQWFNTMSGTTASFQSEDDFVAHLKRSLWLGNLKEIKARLDCILTQTEACAWR